MVHAVRCMVHRYVAWCMRYVAWCMRYVAWCMRYVAWCMRYVASCMLFIASCMLQRVIAYCIAHNFDSDIYEEALDHIWPQCRHARTHARIECVALRTPTRPCRKPREHMATVRVVWDRSPR